jgi:hypothetical protein
MEIDASESDFASWIKDALRAQLEEKDDHFLFKINNSSLEICLKLEKNELECCIKRLREIQSKSS